MVYEMSKGKLTESTIDAAADLARPCVAVVAPDELAAALARFKLPERPKSAAAENHAMLFESHEGYNYICLHRLNRKTLTAPPERIGIYFKKNLLLFADEHGTSAQALLDSAIKDDPAASSLEHLLIQVLEQLTLGDSAILENIETETTDLEDELITTKKRDCIKEIISLRKRLMVLKRHYEQLLDVLDQMQEDENNLLSGSAIRHIKLFTDRVDRLFRAVINLRDYVTQVREAYQAEVDISLNNVMKVLTVLTAIFMPLTFIVGWYGMNLQIPEFKWSFGYPMVIIVSVLVIILCLIYFKKKKWLK